MMPAPDHATDSLADVTESLMPEFADDLPLSVISQVVLNAHRDLLGQVRDGALPELLQRLSRTRLAELRRARLT